MTSKGAPETKAKDDKTVENETVFLAPECPVEKVTVYPDRAEVCRRVEAELSTGMNQVVIKKLPDMVDPDSIRYVIWNDAGTDYILSFELWKWVVVVSATDDYESRSSYMI